MACIWVTIDININIESAMVKEESPVILIFLNH